MARQAVEVLAAQMDEVWARFRGCLEGLEDDEFFWEPVPACWTIHQAEDGRWWVDYETPDPEPPPFTTIAWRLVHVASCKVMYYDHAFGEGKLTWDDLSFPGTATGAIAWLEEGHARLRAVLDTLTNADLDVPRATNWGEQWPTWRILWAMIDHDGHHGAEIGVLRDLYWAMR
jgi:uncharacterized damage-inducible protein DinB